LVSRPVQRDNIEKAIARRKLIRKIMLDGGFKSAYELQDILRDKYDIDMHVETLYNDMIYIDAFKTDDIKAYDNKVLANCEAHLNTLNRLSTEAKYPNQRIQAINAYFKCVQDFKKLLVVLEEKKEVKFEKKPEKEEKVDVKFG